MWPVIIGCVAIYFACDVALWAMGKRDEFRLVDRRKRARRLFWARR